MSVEIDIVYAGQLRCHAVHGPSGCRLSTDAPVDNHGQGESFSPTDLVATALGTCLMTIMGIVADRHGLDLVGTQIHVIKEMIQIPVRRIGALRVTLTIPAEKACLISAADRARLETAALHCPVHQSLHPDIALPIEFIYSEC